MFKQAFILASISVALAGCTPPQTTDGDRGAEITVRDAERANAAPQPAPTIAFGDLPPCHGINPDIRRPPGSNCLGITLQECGADLAQHYVGRPGNPAAKRELAALAIGDFRWIPYMTPATDDLRNARLNVELDADGMIAKIDCY